MYVKFLKKFQNVRKIPKFSSKFTIYSEIFTTSTPPNVRKIPVCT